LRVDVQGSVIRFDLAAPFHDPALALDNRLILGLMNMFLTLQPVIIFKFKKILCC
jgi:hypothetical protein